MRRSRAHGRRFPKLRAFVERHKHKLRLRKRPIRRKVTRTHIETVIQKFTRDEFQAYCENVASKKIGAWRPRGVVLHNTWKPRLSDWSAATAVQRLKNLQRYYEGLGWNGCPHLFIASEGIYTFNPLWKRGTHSPSYNSAYYGIELVGDYDTEAFNANVSANGIHAAACLYDMLGMTPRVGVMKGREIAAGNFFFHKDDPRTTHKTCPGKNVGTKDKWVEWIQERLAAMNAGDHHPPPTPPKETPEPDVVASRPVRLIDLGDPPIAANLVHHDHADNLQETADSLHAAAVGMGQPCDAELPAEPKSAIKSIGIMGPLIAFLFTILGTFGLSYTDADVQSAQHIWPQLLAIGGGAIATVLGMWGRYRAKAPIKGGPADPATIAKKEHQEMVVETTRKAMKDM